MATYFHGNADFQPADGLQTLVLMNPAYSQYSDTPSPAPGNFVFLNTQVGNPLYPLNLPHAPPSLSQHLVGVPLSAATSPATSQDPNCLSMHTHHDVSALHGYIPRTQNGFWSSIDQTSSVAREATRSKEGLSLTLSSHPPGYGLVQIPSRAQREVSGEDVRISGGSSSSASGLTNSIPAIRGMLHSSKYLRAAQELLDEVANVGNIGVKKETLKKTESHRTKLEESQTAVGDNSVRVEEEGEPASELSAADRQEIQMKKAKLINMLDEVEQRYRQYHHQMQILISSFEQAAGIGSARTYTALALQTISKQFRCLKDAITAQIRVANKNLGEEDGHGKLEGSRLRFVDHHLNQQRALQSLGMIQHNAWRPQRGLPERSVSVLRAWLFEHFLHPYPKDSDKHMLAKQTGLTRSQVSNWFINARVRLWKPMVEEMYSEEIKEQGQTLSPEKSSKSNDDTTSKSTKPSTQEKSPPTKNQLSALNSKQGDSLHHHAPPANPFSSNAASVEAENVRSQSGFWLIGSSELDGITQGSPKRQRIAETAQSPSSMPINIDMKQGEDSNEQVFMKFNNGVRHGRDGYSFIGGQANFIGGFGQYPIADIDRFDGEPFPTGFSGNGVSLTLGLHHSDNLSLSVANQSFLPNQTISFGRRVDIGEPNGFDAINISTPHSTSAFDGIDIQNRKRFVAQLLPDFVA